MIRTSTPAATSVLLPYGTNPYSHFIRSLKFGQAFAALISLCTILSDFLPLLFANIPFNKATTWKAHLACTWSSIAIVMFMDLAIVGTAVALYRRRPAIFVDVKLLKRRPLASHLLLASQSPEMTRAFREISEMGTERRDRYIKDLGFRYKLERTEGKGLSSKVGTFPEGAIISSSGGQLISSNRQSGHGNNVTTKDSIVVSAAPNIWSLGKALLGSLVRSALRRTRSLQTARGEKKGQDISCLVQL